MPIYMDRHNVPGIEAKHAAEAHREDLKIQDRYSCRCMTYWVDEARGSAFCLIDAPNKAAVIKLHEEAHGLLPHEIIQVNSNVVEAFLGRINDPQSYNHNSGDNLKVFNDPSFRVILKTQTSNQKLLEHQLGLEKANSLSSLFSRIIKEQIHIYEGREVELRDSGFVVSFISVSLAIQCAIAIQKNLHVAAELMDLRIGLHAGLPVNNNDIIFGDTLKFTKYLCDIGKGGQILISSLVQELSKEDHHRIEANSIVSMTAEKENFLETLMSTLYDHWQNTEFTIKELGEKMSISKSQLYRKCVAMTGVSPNQFLCEFRLQRALEFLKTNKNISETAFDCGFNSPSYFAKCFQKRFGLQPLGFRKMQT